MPVLVEDGLRAFFAMGRNHLFEIARHGRVIGMNGVMHAGVAMTIRPNTDTHILEKFVGRHERRVDFDRHGLFGSRRRLLPDLDRGASRGLMRDHRVGSVGLVLHQHLPIAIVHVAQHASGNFESPGRRTVDHVVDAAEAFAEKLFEIGTCVIQLCKDEAPIISYVAHGADALARVARLEPGVLVSLPQRDKEQ